MGSIGDLQFLQVFKRAYSGFSGIRDEHPGSFWFIIIFNAVLAVVLTVLYIRAAKPVWKHQSFLWKLLYVLGCGIKLVLIPTISVFFMMTDQVDLDVEDLLNNRYYAEIIVMTVISSGAFVLHYLVSEKYPLQTGDDGGGDDDVDSGEAIELGKQLLRDVILIVLSVLFIFTRLDSWMPGAGFSIKGKPIGAVLYSCYCAWSGAIVLRAAQNVVTLLHYLTLVPRIKRQMAQQKK